jgi:sterol desaturase/sphingolipid hydroxylase (fatty acid hydroxylase superfamily)
LIKQTLQYFLVSFGGGFLSQLLQDWLVNHYFNDFLKTNLVNLLVALLAINITTLGIVLTRLRELTDKYECSGVFDSTKQQMLASIREQLGLIVFSIAALNLLPSPKLIDIPSIDIFVNSLISACFIYAMMILYDTAKSVFIIIDFTDGK